MSKKIVIADDEDLVRTSLAKYIKNHCPMFDQIFEAANGGEAVEQILKNDPDIVILDVQMPVLTGIDVMRKISQSSVKPMVIILSGFNEFTYAQQAMHYGAKDYIMKPVKASELVQRIEELMNEKYSEKTEEIPENTKSISVTAAEYIADHFSEDLTLSIVAEKLGISSSYLSNRFSVEMNIGFVDYVNKIRISRACDYLKQNCYKVYEISEKVGFNDTKYFAKTFKKIVGKTPKEYMQGK